MQAYKQSLWTGPGYMSLIFCTNNGYVHLVRKTVFVKLCEVTDIIV